MAGSLTIDKNSQTVEWIFIKDHKPISLILTFKSVLQK